MAVDDLSVEIVERQRVSLIRVEGSIDAKTTPSLGDLIQPSLASNVDLVLDLTRVKFVSSAGLRLLLIVYRKLKDESRALILVGVSDDIARVMSHTGFLPYFTLVNTEADALSALPQR